MTALREITPMSALARFYHLSWHVPFSVMVTHVAGNGGGGDGGGEIGWYSSGNGSTANVELSKFRRLFVDDIFSVIFFFLWAWIITEFYQTPKNTNLSLTNL